MKVKIDGNFYNYLAVQTALSSHDAGVIIPITNTTTSNNFFVTNAEAKALGLISGSSTGIDGYIGIGKSSSINFSAEFTGTIGATQYDGVGIAAHELSEVMGRIGMEGGTLGTTHNVYTPLDLFRYTSPGVLDLTPTSGYFSINAGAGGETNLNTYNNPANGGDAADWASTVANDAYDAFGTPGVITNVSSTDLIEVAALGYHLNGSPTKIVA